MGHNHSAPVLSVQPGDTVQILCRASQDIGNDMELYHFKPGQAPRGLIHDSNQKYPYTPSRFSGLLNGALTTTITEVQVEVELPFAQKYVYIFGHIFNYFICYFFIQLPSDESRKTTLLYSQSNGSVTIAISAFDSN
uniref:Immunoglobulin V-set domain-containing protein n=1 Tax=Oncorhynchus kisutch TaxID=8019 RepID=A0A8C7EZY7_ONCKI